jgi:DNA-directed RNA polymerase subunit RPC12/RpoP
MTKNNKSPIELIKDGINNQDWDSICKAYQILSGTKIKSPKNNNSETNQYKEILFNLYNNLSDLFNDNTTTQDDEDDVEKEIEEINESDDVPDEDINEEMVVSKYSDIHSGPSEGLKTGTVNLKENKIYFPGSELIDKKEQNANKKLLKQSNKIKRSPYQPSLIKCTKCTHEFDIKKNPSCLVLTAPKENREMRCPKCRENFPI